MEGQGAEDLKRLVTDFFQKINCFPLMDAYLLPLTNVMIDKIEKM